MAIVVKASQMMRSNTPDDIKLLARKWQEGTINDSERKAFEEWYNGQDNVFELESAENETQMGERIYNSILERAEINVPKSARLWPGNLSRTRIGIAVAAAVAIVVFGTSLWYFNTGALVEVNTVLSNDIAPGKDGATLTLADGRKVLINDALAGNIAEQSGVRISKSADGGLVYEVLDNGSGKLEYNTLQTTRGEQTQVRLPDGSVVFLNALSSLRYPTSFKGQDKRSVLLSGEAYFEVAKDRSHAFVVATDQQQVEVLGTHFNINNYADGKGVKTTLLEGSVRVYPVVDKENSIVKTRSGIVLKPNEQATFAGGLVSVRAVDSQDAVAWKNGQFIFEEESLEDIMNYVERWYDVEVVYADGVNRQKKYWGGVSRYDKVSKLLENLQLTGNIHFKIEGRRIMVMN